MAGMTVDLGLAFPGDAKAAADEFIMKLNKQAVGIAHLGDAISMFNSKGDLIAQTFKAIGTAGEKMEVTLKMGAQGFELITGSTNKAAESLRKYKEQQKLILEAQRRNQANSAEATLRDSLNTTGMPIAGTATQASGMEAVFQRVRAAIESGSVSLARFRQIYDQITANPKAIIPNLTAEEAKVASAIRTVIGGFDSVTEAGKKTSTYLQSMLGFVGRIFGSQVIGRITGFLSQSFNEGIETAKKFSIQIAEIETISQRSGVSTEQWASGLRNLSAQFGNTQADVASAAYEALSNQITKGADTFAFLQSSSKFALASVSNLTDAVNLGSSAIRAFNLPVTDSEKIFASFFKTIELGRVKAKDIADNFGRVAGVAGQVGVSLFEVQAALATITNKGIPASEAMTLVNNIMLKLIRPTDEMKLLLNEWGVASGTAAISTFGFAGVLQKLELEAQKGGSRLGDLFNQIRAVRGAFALSGGGFADFSANLEEIKNAQSSYDEAANLVAKSFGQRFKIEMNKVAVFFTEEFGDQIVKGGVQIADALGGADTVVRRLTQGIILASAAGSALLGGMVAGRIAGIAAATVIELQTAMLSKNALANLTAAEAEARRAAAVASTTAVVSTFVTGFGIGVLLDQWLNLGQYIETAAQKAQRFKDIQSGIEKDIRTKFSTYTSGNDTDVRAFDQAIEQTRESFKARYQFALQYYSSQQKLSQQLKDRTTQHLKDTTEATKVASKGFFDSFTKNLSELRKAAAEAEQMIKDSLKSSEGLTRKTTDEIFNKRLSYASEGNIDVSGFVMGEQKTALIKNRISELQELADKKFKEGTQESVQDARKLYDEIRQQQGALLDATVSKQRREFDERVRRGEETATSTDFDPVTGQMKQRFEFVVRTADFERQINETKNQQLAAEEKLREVQRDRMAKVEEEEKREKEKLRTVQQAFEALNKINVLDKEGKVKDEFKDTKIKVGDQTVNIPGSLKALEEFDRQADIIRQAAAGKDLQTQVSVNAALFQQRKALADQIEAANTDARIRGEAERLTISNEATQKQISFAKDRLANNDQEIKERAEKLAVALEKIKFFDTENRDEAAGIGKPRDAIAKFAKNTSSQNFKDLNSAFEEFKNNYDNWLKESGANKEGVAGLTGDALERFQQLSEAFKGVSEATTSRAKARETFLQDFRVEGEKLSEALNSIPGSFELIDQAVNNIQQPVTQNLQTITRGASDLVRNLRDAVETLKRLNAEVPALRQGLGGEGLAVPDRFGGPVRYLAGGGFVGFQPRGSDTVPAMLDPREYVMTTEATKRFEPVLRAMNSMSPQYMAKGGSPISVGDVNVTVNGGNTAPQTIREIAKGMRRGIKNKTIKLT